MNEPFDCLVAGHPTPMADDGPVGRAELAARLHDHIADTVRRLAGGAVDIRRPDIADGLLPHGSGHFHLAAELFIQLSGWTLFHFQHGELRLEAGQVLLVPARLLHSEQVGGDADGGRFENLVVYAEDGAFRCHLAQEVSPGVPGILYLDMGRHPQAGHIQDWLSAAAQVTGDDAARAEGWGDIQSRALVTAALTALLDALGERQNEHAPEPMLVSRVRVMVQNQLGDRTLSVRGLATQTGYSADYLSNLFSVATGEHLSAYISRLRVERAAHLLRESTLSGKEIAWACGFASPSYFIRAFRAHFGKTPKAWRH